MLSRDELLKSRRPPFEEVDLPELGGSVVLQGMTVAKRDRFLKKLGEDRVLPPEQQLGYTTLLLLWTLADANGNPLCTMPDAVLIGELSSAVTDPLVAIAERLSGLQIKPPVKTETPAKN